MQRIERKSSKKAVGASNKFKGRKKMSLANDYKGISDRVTVIAATTGNKTDKIRVAAYCRVSTDKTDQVNSFITQMRYYTDYIKSNTKMILIDIYADEGISGTLMDKRDEFKRLLKDCKNRKIDRVLVKSVTRFARNSLECIEAVRELKSYGVSVFFENDKIDTENMNSEMLLYIKSAFAQNESMSLEANRGCGVLYLDTVTPDGFGSPKMKIIVKYAGENAESELYFGSVKPEAVTFDLGGVATIRFAMKNKPVEYVILESFGEDSIFVSNVRLLFGGVKYSVCGVQKTGGKVINEQNIAKCDTTFAELGESSGIKHLDDVSLAKIPNRVKLCFDKIV